MSPTRQLPPRLVVVRPSAAVARPVQAWRLTPRGRLVLALVGLTVLALAVLGGAGLARGSEGASDQVRVVTVRPGETLSEIAAREQPGASLRDAVLQIELANGLNSSAITAGQVLRLPSTP